MSKVLTMLKNGEISAAWVSKKGRKSADESRYDVKHTAQQLP